MLNHVRYAYEALKKSLGDAELSVNSLILSLAKVEKLLETPTATSEIIDNRIIEMDTNLFCEDENCISDTSVFYFKADKQRKVCDAHLPTYGEKLYPIEQFYFIESPEDETKFLRRQNEARQGNAALEKILSLADDEQNAALASLEKNKARAVQVICDVYEAEKRRTRQHFHQIEVIIKDFIQELDLYLFKKENCLSSPLDKLTTELSGLSFLRVRTVENDLELAQVVMSSCSRGELSFDIHLKTVLDPKLRTLAANQLYQLAKSSSLTKSYIELQQALANCTESEALNKLPEVTKLKNYLKDRLDSMKLQRKSELLDLVMHDPEPIKSMFDLHLKEISIQKAAKQFHQVERLYWKALNFALPESQSKVTLNTLLSFAQWSTEQGQEKTSELKKTLKAALKILTAYYPNSLETMKTHLQLGKFYQEEKKYIKALKHCEASVAIGRAEFADSKETAEALSSLGTVYYLVNLAKDAEASYKAALDILDASFQESSERAAVYASLGMLYRAMKRFNEAESHYQRSVDILRPYFPSSRLLAETLTQFGRFYDSRGSKWKAEICLREACQTSFSNSFQDLLEQLLKEGYKPPTGGVPSFSTRVNILWAAKLSPLHRKISPNDIISKICSYIGDAQKLIAVLENEVKCFDVDTSQWQQLVKLRKDIQADSDASSTFIPPNRIFLTGGWSKGASCTCHVDSSAYMLEGDGTVRELNMSTGRACPGVAWDSVRQALYVFGGRNNGGTCYTAHLRTSEMFLSEWSPLPDMHDARSSFNPCWHSSVVYLCGGNAASVETYDPRSNTFALPDFTLPEETSTTAVADEGMVTVISRNYISKLQQGGLTSKKHDNFRVWSNCTPLVIGGAVYVVTLYDECCRSIDLTTGSLLKTFKLS